MLDIKGLCYTKRQGSMEKCVITYLKKSTFEEVQLLLLLVFLLTKIMLPVPTALLGMGEVFGGNIYHYTEKVLLLLILLSTCYIVSSLFFMHSHCCFLLMGRTIIPAKNDGEMCPQQL